MLEGKRFRLMFRGVHICSDVALDLETWVRAARLVLPADAALSHTSCLRWMGREAGSPWPLHFSTNTKSTTDLEGISLHRRQGTMHPRTLRGIDVLGPDRTFVDSAPLLGFVGAVESGDWLVHHRWTTLSQLGDYCDARHLDGVVQARHAAAYVRERVESPRETLTRLIVAIAGLPEPDTNRNILDDGNRFVARGGMPYFGWKVLVEYDGQHHEKDPGQRQRDRERREALEGLGWRVIIVTAKDMADKPQVAWRIYREGGREGGSGRAR